MHNLMTLKTIRESSISRISNYEPRTNKVIDASKIGDFQSVEKMVANGVDINGHNYSENTPLTNAAERGDIKSIEFLCGKLNANVHESCDCPYHMTAIHYASKNGHVEVIEMLLKYGANVNVKDSRNKTALDVAINNDVAKILSYNGCVEGNKILLVSSQYLPIKKCDDDLTGL